MITAIRKQFSVWWRDWISMALIVLGVGIFGKILFHVIVYMDGEVGNYFPMATLLGCFAVAFIALLISCTQLQICFNVQVSMGSTRKQFFVSFLVTCFVGTLIYVLLLLGINLAENAMNAAMFPTWESEFDLFPYLLKWGVPVSILLTLIGGLCGALMMRFGKTAFWIMWALWMIVCIGGPQIHDAVEEAPDTLYGRIGMVISNLVRSIPVSAWVLAGVVVGIAALAGTWVILRKQQVTT